MRGCSKGARHLNLNTKHQAPTHLAESVVGMMMLENCASAGMLSSGMVSSHLFHLWERERARIVVVVSKKGKGIGLEVMLAKQHSLAGLAFHWQSSASRLAGGHPSATHYTRVAAHTGADRQVRGADGDMRLQCGWMS